MTGGFVVMMFGVLLVALGFFAVGSWIVQFGMFVGFVGLGMHAWRLLSVMKGKDDC